MGQIDTSYIVTALVTFLIGVLPGAIIAYRCGVTSGKFKIMKTGLTVKNPEMWELLHFFAVEDDEEARIKAEEKHRRKVELAEATGSHTALEKKTDTAKERRGSRAHKQDTRS